MRGSLATLALGLALGLAAVGCGRLGFAQDVVRDGAADTETAPRIDARAPGDAATTVLIGFEQTVSAALNGPPSGTTVNATFMQDLHAGDLIVLCLDYDFDAASPPPNAALADSQGNVYEIAVGPGTMPGYAQAIYYAFAAADAPDELTVALSTPDNEFIEVHLSTYTGATALDDTSSAAGLVGSADAVVDAAPVTAHVAGELIVGCEIGNPGAATAGAESTLRSGLDSDVMEDRFAPAPGTYVETVDAAQASQWTFTVASFR